MENIEFINEYIVEPHRKIKFSDVCIENITNIGNGSARLALIQYAQSFYRPRTQGANVLERALNVDSKVDEFILAKEIRLRYTSQLISQDTYNEHIDLFQPNKAINEYFKVIGLTFQPHIKQVRSLRPFYKDKNGKPQNPIDTLYKGLTVPTYYNGEFHLEYKPDIYDETFDVLDEQIKQQLETVKQNA